MICSEVDEGGRAGVWRTSSQSVNGTSHFYEMDSRRVCSGLRKAHLQWEDQCDCTEECGKELVPLYGTDGMVKSFCNDAEGGELRSTAWKRHRGTKVVADFRDLCGEGGARWLVTAMLILWVSGVPTKIRWHFALAYGTPSKGDSRERYRCLVCTSRNTL